MGICVTRERQVHIDGVSAEELIVFQSECSINLHMVPFEVFRSQIKRYGYATDLTDKHMRHISQALMLDCDEMYTNEKSNFALVYLDDAFRSADKRHNVRKLLRLGWLCCLFRSIEEQKTELWNLINPTMAESIQKADIMDFLQTLTHFVVVINKKMLVIDEDAVQHITPSIAYLEQAEENLSTFLGKIEKELPRRINRDDCIELFGKYGLFRSYTMREQIAGKRLAPRKLPNQKEMQQAMPTPSPPKRTRDFGKKVVEEQTETEEFDFSVDGSQYDEGPFAPASPQTTPPQPASKPKGTKKKKVKLIKPYPTN